MKAALGLLRTLRPHQWVKNVFVAAPLVFAQHLTEVPYLWRTGAAILAFCLLSGAVYAFNDVRDVEADRAHPKKKHRPIASGQLSERTALISAGVLALVALGGALAIRWQLAMFAAIYLVQNIAYSVKLKQVAFLDVCIIATGFLLRVLAGAAAIDVPASGWLLLCTALVATFFGFGKRAHELAWAQKAGDGRETRAALQGYSLPHLKLAMYVLAVATCAAYVAYTLDEHTMQMFGSERLVISAPFVAIGVVRFLSLALWRPKDDSPTEAMLHDPWFLANGAGAIASILYAIYG
ncbi:MAG: decaprenyl-phosphate phosphoribosyltransferase [Myxococcales bacterium]|nr:decaprenyl-phosphate phosphoribosyltransferase [Myxococcales bacterium]